MLSEATQPTSATTLSALSIRCLSIWLPFTGVFHTLSLGGIA